MLTRRATLAASSFSDFGSLLRVLRLRARLTQRELGLAVGYSEAQISRLEQHKRLPDPAVVAALFLPALRLGGEPDLAARLHELAVQARTEPANAESEAAGSAVARADGAGGVTAADHAELPPLPSHHVERSAVSSELRDRLATDRCVLMTGLPGTGKTSLATLVARKSAASVCWITLTAGITTSAEAIIRQLARFLAGHGNGGVAPLCAPGHLERSPPRDEQLYLITTALRDLQALICLDNAHVLWSEPDARKVIEHVAGASPAMMLAISREDVPLAGFTPMRLGGMTDDEARALVGLVGGPVIPRPVAAALIDKTGGSPMLIRLAMGQLRPAGPTPEVLVERLEAEPGIAAFLLQSTLSDLSEPSRRLLALTAVFRHPVDLLDARLIEASEQISGPYDVLAGLDELRRRQLVDHPARAEVHPLVRDHVYASLVGAAAGRVRLHLLAAHHCEQVLVDPLEATWHYWRAGHHVAAGDLLAARVADLTAAGRSEAAADLAATLLRAAGLPDDSRRQLLVARGELLLHTERAGEAEDAYRQALGIPAAEAVRAGVSWRLAQSLLQRGQVPEALDLCRSAAARLTAEDHVLRGQLAAMQARAHLMLSELADAEALAQQACAAADSIAELAPEIASAIRARAFWVLGVSARLRGRPDEAVALLHQAADAAGAAGLREVAGRALFNLGAIAHEHGDGVAASDHYARALVVMRPIGDGYGIARVLHGLALLRSQSGSPAEAARLLEEARVLKLRMGDTLGAANSEHSLALILLSQGRSDEARARLAAIVASTAQLGERHVRAQYLDSLAMVELADGEHLRARELLGEAAAIAAAVDSPSLAVVIRLHTAYAALAAGDIGEAATLADDCGLMAAVADGTHAASALEHMALSAALALIAGDQIAAAGAAARMAAHADRVADQRYAGAARRIAAVIDAPPGRERPPVHAQLARLVWVADQAD